MYRNLTILASVIAATAAAFGGCGKSDDGSPSIDSGAPVEAGADANVACTTDLMRDPKNCGTCAHDCLGGTCTGGTCDPATLVGNLDLPNAMILDGTYLYFAYSGHVARILAAASADGGTVEDLSSAAFTAQKLAVDATYVYVMTGTGVIRFPKSGDAGGGAVESLTYAVGKSLAVDVSNIFFQYPTGLAGAPKTGTGDGGVGDGGAGVLLAALGSDTITDIAVDDTNAFFSLPGQGTVLKVAKTGAPDGGATTIATGESFPSAIVLDDSYVYFTNNMGGTIRRLAKAGGMPTDFVTGIGQPVGLFIDATRLYYTDQVKGVVGSCPLTGCAGGMQTHAIGISPVAVAADAVAIYFLDYNGRALMRVAR